MITWIQENIVEIIGVCLAFFYLLLEIKQKWTMWIVGIISSAFYVYIFFQNKLYAQMGLNSYYVAMSIYGLYCWKFLKNKKQEAIKINNITTKKALKLSITTIIIFAILSYILLHFTDSPIPYPDAFVAALSIVATWMLARKIIEQWYVWIFADLLSIGMCIYQKLYATSILFIVYCIMSLIGLIEWKKIIRQETEKH